MFSDNEINTGRQDELDIVKGLAIIFMVWCHVYRELGADTTTLPGIMVDSILGGPFAAPMFMICMGGRYLLFQKSGTQTVFCERL